MYSTYVLTYVLVGTLYYPVRKVSELFIFFCENQVDFNEARLHEAIKGRQEFLKVDGMRKLITGNRTRDLSSQTR